VWRFFNIWGAFANIEVPVFRDVPEVSTVAAGGSRGWASACRGFRPRLL